MPSSLPDARMVPVRVDAWVWAVRLFRTRSEATAACRGGHVIVNGERAKAAARIRPGDEVRVRRAGAVRIVEVRSTPVKRISAQVAAECLIDRTPAPAPGPIGGRAAPVVRERGAGRPTKRDRRELERLRGTRD